MPFHSQRGPIVDNIWVRSKVRTYIIDNLLLGVTDDFDDNTPLMEAGILDSTAAMEVVAFLESTFGISIEDDDIIPENLNSVDHICEFVVRLSS
jgi:acyl carrier protein